MADENLSPLERMRKRLYEPEQPSAPVSPHLKEEHLGQSPGTWTPPAPPVEKKRISPYTYFLVGAVAFFIVSAILAVLFLFFGARSVSTDNVDLTVKGPTSIASGDTVSLVLTIENRNPTPITDTSISVEFPEGTRSADNTSESMVLYTDTVGDVLPGEKTTRTARAVISGRANQIVTIPVVFEYRTEGSNATFQKKEEYTFTITSSPISLTVSTLGESASGQPVTITVAARANGVDPVDNVAVLAEYPFGFTLKSAEPSPAGNLFTLGTIAPGETKTIKITGVLSGQQSDERVFRFTAGVPKGEGSQALAVSYTTQESAVTITRPFLGVSLALNRDTADTVIARAGTAIQGTLTWVNTLPVPVTDAEIRVKVQGDAVDYQRISSASGYYRSSDTTVVYNRDEQASLARLDPNDTGGGTFTVPMKTGASMNALRNPSITFVVSVSGKRLSESGVPETVSSSVTKTVKVSTDLTLTSRAVRTIGPFTNTGPWPPVADTPTTYTIIMTAGNTVNSVGGAKVTTTLPSYVSFTGATSPNDGSITYNTSTREVTWSIGDMPAGTSGKTGSFQISFLPSASQRGTSPVLVFPQTITGTDRFVQKQVTGAAGDITTKTTTDPSYNPDYGNVAR